MARAAKTAKVAGSETRTIEFIGPPRRLVAVGEVPTVLGTPRISGKLETFLVLGRQALRVRSAGRRGAARIGLRLDPATPPGDYEGEMAAGEEAYRIRARVLPDMRVTVMAGELAFSGSVGETATASLAIANDGNTQPLAIP